MGRKGPEGRRDRLWADRTARPGRMARLRQRDDRGQAAVEFAGTLPVALITLALLWQAAVIGYTFSLAGNAADAAARSGAVDGPAACRAAGEADLPGAWAEGASFDCPGNGDGLYRVTVTFSVPVLFPGAVNLPFDFDAEAAAVDETP